MKSELLKVLRQADDYVSGQQLCSRFGVSRTAVWKAIRQLQEAGYEIDAVNNRGYRFLSAPDLLTPEEIRSRLHTGFMGQNCICLESVDSTNNYVKKLAEDGAEEGTLVLAEEQTGGKGRRGRVWETPKGKNIAMSLLLRPKIHPAHASQLTLLMAMAVGEAIRSCTGLEAGIKWPNDVVVNGRKICGILTEMNTEVDYINYVVIGTGINVNQQEFPEELREIAGSLRQNLGKETGRAAIVAAGMDELERLYDIFRKTEDLSALKDDYNRCCVNRGHGIRVMERGEAYTGTTEGINDHGELVVRKDSGEEVLVYAGEVSVRGLYGYT
ncbi:MAG: biotin--[acetyl-CoA-carboxylase] ligase [Lachnospiraceae bacterium]|nr:biotin--[acetyl-CoA-carboxylase] ligase [Lachnospiraceae bacterium]